VAVRATDWYDDALRFARANAERNALAPLDTGHLDWLRHDGEERFPLVIAADVLYEVRNAEALADVLPRVVAAGGRALVADPGRVYERGFRNRMALAGWTVREADRREEISDPATGAVSTVRIWELRPPG
jgi:predicted nicotinamide N-methyase